MKEDEAVLVVCDVRPAAGGMRDVKPGHGAFRSSCSGGLRSDAGRKRNDQLARIGEGADDDDQEADDEARDHELKSQ